MKKTLQIISAVILIIVLFGFLLDDSYYVEEKITINTSREIIHPLVNDLKQWPKWEPWTDMDDTIVTTLGPITEGVGASQKWTSKDGPGALTFTSSSLEKGIAYDLYFGGEDASEKTLTTMSYSLESPDNPDQVTVTWTMKGVIGVPVLGPYIRMMVESQTPAMFRNGLKKLKTAAEATS